MLKQRCCYGFPKNILKKKKILHPRHYAYKTLRNFYLYKSDTVETFPEEVQARFKRRVFNIVNEVELSLYENRADLNYSLPINSPPSSKQSTYQQLPSSDQSTYNSCQMKPIFLQTIQIRLLTSTQNTK